MKQQKGKGQSAPIARGLTRATAKRLLEPIAVLLRAGGISSAHAKAAFSGALNAVKTKRLPRKLERIGYSTVYADIVTRWSREPRFLDRHGRPKALPLTGRVSIATLARTSGQNLTATDVLKVLLRYGNVEPDGNGKYELVRSYFFTANEEAVALEPMAYFLADAGTTFQRILDRPAGSTSPQLFWRKVEVDSLSDRAAGEFQKFMHHRTLTFLEEVDDWLAAHAGRRSAKKAGRVGLGLFTFHDSDHSA